MSSDRTVELLEILRPMQERMLNELERVPPVVRSKVERSLLTALRLTLVSKRIDEAWISAWEYMKRAWRDLRLPEKELQYYHRLLTSDFIEEGAEWEAESSTHPLRRSS